MSSPSAASYHAVLRAPLAGRTFVSALVGRLSYGIVFLSLVLAVTRATGSYTMAGTAMALFGLASSLLSPLRALLIDRYGIRRALPPMAAAYALLLSLVAVLTWRPGTPGAVLWLFAGLTGAFTPPLGPVMRTLWRDLLPEGPLLRRAYSLDTVAEELLYVIGPLIAGVLTGLAHPSLGIALSAGLVTGGSLALAFSPATRPPAAPPPAERPAVSGRSRAAAEVPAVSQPVDDGRTVGRRSPVAGATGLRRPIVVAGGVGMCLGALSLLIVAFAERHGQLAAVAWVEAALATGSAVGGLAYGAVSWRLGLERWLPLLATALALSLAAAGFAPDMVALSLLVGVAGLFVSPVLTTAYMLADEVADPGSRTQAGAWVNTAFNTGHSAGSASVGLLIGRHALATCFVAGALPSLLGALAGLGKARRPARLSTREAAVPDVKQ
ncbi:MFS transporter [Nonomuraea sp. SMC257]|uniref:MFS transporter n=1 Tax=Nonomuraea montanisoli TaxID=2741721 RepID=A0A7Y6I1A3_9ACTN|nr:MFS transporter [Nonomuraea montanisoli]NUW29862.1 MFS transporter [Nonomuraea montanisoli]